MMPDPVMAYVADDTVDAVLDARIRALLTRCFTRPQDAVFRERRYYISPYPHRWIVRDAGGTLMAHAGVHEKRICAGRRAFRVGGVAEVCVHPDWQGKGWMKGMLQAIHAWLRHHGFSFSVLMGEEPVYRSSGYRPVANLFYDAAEHKTPQRCTAALALALTDVEWPEGEVYMPGPLF